MIEQSFRTADSVGVVAVKDVIGDVADWAEAWAAERELRPDVIFAMRLCVEEAVTNIVMYAYDPMFPPGGVSVTARLEPDRAVVVIADQGRPFDLTAASEPGTEADIETATIGGRGVRLIRAFSDAQAYERREDQNVLTLSFLRDKPPQDR